MKIVKKYKYIILGFIAVFVLYFSFRTTVLKMVFSKVQGKLSSGYALTLNAEKVAFTGFKTVTFQGFEIKQDTSTLLYIDTLKVNPRFWPLLIGKVLLKEIDIREGRFNFNISQLQKIRKLKSNQPTDSIEESSKNTNYSKFMYGLINTYFEYIPSRLKIDRFDISYKHDTTFVSCTVNQFLLKKNKYSGSCIISDNSSTEKLIVSGNINNSNERMSFQIKNEEKGQTVKFPYIGPRWQSWVSFDSLYGQFEVEKYRSGVLDLKISSGIQNFVVKDNRIGPEPVITKTGSGDLKIRITERAFEIDSTSKVAFNEFQFSPYFRFEKNPNRVVTLKIIKQEFEASKLFKSFPEGLFDNISKLETKGNLIYSLSASLNLDYPDSVTLDSKMEKKDFSIVKYGGDDFRKMNGSFRYDVYDHGQFIRSFIIGPENPDFTPAHQVSPYLKYSILTSEDGDFFYHRGFNQDAFRESISKNYSEKRFARGGSTISMQLVKNVFLSRKKTIARKIEEMLTVWMIENLRLSSKERMFEVYLNIIEWGPNIYGVKEASRFYFNKMPSQLNLNECIFLTSIIPRPKGFKYAFDTTGHLRNHYAGYYKLLSGIMLRREQISPFDTLDLKPDVELTGPAKLLLTKPVAEREAEDSVFFIEPKSFLIETRPLKVEEKIESKE
jgi:hypothetical protein